MQNNYYYLFAIIIIIFMADCNANPMDPYELDEKIANIKYLNVDSKGILAENLHAINKLGAQYHAAVHIATHERISRYRQHYGYIVVGPMSYYCTFDKYLEDVYLNQGWFEEIQNLNSSECMSLAKSLLVKTPAFNMDPDAQIPMIFHNNGNADLKVSIYKDDSSETQIHHSLLYEKTIAPGCTWNQSFFYEYISDESFYITAKDTSIPDNIYGYNILLLDDFKPYADKLECNFSFTAGMDNYIRFDTLYYDFSFWTLSFWNMPTTAFMERAIPYQPRYDRDPESVDHPSFNHHYMNIVYSYYWDKFEDKFGSVF